MIVEHPVYKIHVNDKLCVAEGIGEVTEIYRSMVNSQSSVINHTDEHIMVSDEASSPTIPAIVFGRGIS